MIRRPECRGRLAFRNRMLCGFMMLGVSRVASRSTVKAWLLSSIAARKRNAPSCRSLFAFLGRGLNSITTAGAVEARSHMEGYSELMRVKGTGHLAVPTRIFVRARGLPELAPGNIRG